MTNKQRAQHFFARNPKADEFFITSNGRGFSEEHQADAYAQRLSDRKLTKIERKDLKESNVTPPSAKETITDTTAAVGGTLEQTGPASKNETKEGAADKAPGLEDMGFEDLKSLATEKGIDLKGLNSKDKVREAIKAKDAEKAGAGEDESGAGEAGAGTEEGGAGEAGAEEAGAGEQPDPNEIKVNGAETVE